jgi:ABC-type transport system involved in multi-copper enzyme maturation permease subunit
MSAPGRPAPPSALAATFRVFDLSFAQMLWSRRSIFLALVTGGPVVLAALLRTIVTWGPGSALQVNGARPSGAALYGLVIWLLYIRFIVPVLGVFYGTALIADEVDDKTITYLFTRPIRRGAVLGGKYLAYLLCTILLVLPSVVLDYFLVVPLAGSGIGANFPALVEDLGMLAVGLAAYGAVFAYVGARLKRPLVAGLVFAFGWEPGVLIFPGYVKRLTVAYYLQGLVPHAMPNESAISAILQFFTETPSVPVSLSALALITAAALWGASRSVERREYVLEQ